MKYDVTQEDRDIMARDMQTDRTLKHIANLSFYKFSVGDVLVREEKYHDYKNDKIEWKVRADSNNIPYKYVYVFENELEVGYIRRLSVNGQKFVERPMCITEFDPHQTRFSLDPEYADHMLLAAEGEEFDTKSRYSEVKKKRERIHRANKKLAVPMADEAACLAWMKTLKVGDQFWYGYSISHINKEPNFVHEIQLQQTQELRNPNAPPDFWNTMIVRKPHIKTSTLPPGNPAPGGRTGQFDTDILVHYYVFMTRPTFFDEIIN